MASSAPVSHLRDVGKSIDVIARRTYVKPGRLYICGMLKDADPREKDKMRLEFKVKTVVDTKGFKDRYIRSPADHSTYVAEFPNAFAIEEVLGLQYCTVAIRGGKYREQDWKRIPTWEKMYDCSCAHVPKTKTDAEALVGSWLDSTC
nr:hypothetical protein CFP56_11789 [Quercus suber]